jgi:hypothetical protein
MTQSTGRHGSRIMRVLGTSGVAALLLAAGCSNSSTGGDPSIHAKADRTDAGTMQALKVDGKHFTPNGPVLVTVLLSGSGANASPYVEETIQADADGKIKYEKRPVACPQPATYGSGSWTLVTARDMTSGISGSASLDPGAEPDCKS